METLECEPYAVKLPSEDFIRAVASFLETDATDILAEMGYVPNESVEELQPATK